MVVVTDVTLCRSHWLLKFKKLLWLLSNFDDNKD